MMAFAGREIIRSCEATPVLENSTDLWPENILHHFTLIMGSMPESDLYFRILLGFNPQPFRSNEPPYLEKLSPNVIVSIRAHCNIIGRIGFLGSWESPFWRPAGIPDLIDPKIKSSFKNRFMILYSTLNIRKHIGQLLLVGFIGQGLGKARVIEK